MKKILLLLLALSAAGNLSPEAAEARTKVRYKVALKVVGSCSPAFQHLKKRPIQRSIIADGTICELQARFLKIETFRRRGKPVKRRSVVRGVATVIDRSDGYVGPFVGVSTGTSGGSGRIILPFKYYNSACSYVVTTPYHPFFASYVRTFAEAEACQKFV